MISLILVVGCGFAIALVLAYFQRLIRNEPEFGLWLVNPETGVNEFFRFHMKSEIPKQTPWHESAITLWQVAYFLENYAHPLLVAHEFFHRPHWSRYGGIPMIVYYVRSIIVRGYNYVTHWSERDAESKAQRHWQKFPSLTLTTSGRVMATFQDGNIIWLDPIAR